MSENSRILVGALAIAEHLGLDQQQVRHLAKRKRLPLFKLGANLAARPAALDAHFAALEAAATNNNPEAK